MSLEGLDRSVLAKLANMDAHVRAAGGKRVIALPVHVQSGSCQETETETKGLKTAAAAMHVSLSSLGL